MAAPSLLTTMHSEFGAPPGHAPSYAALRADAPRDINNEDGTEGLHCPVSQGRAQEPARHISHSLQYHGQCQPSSPQDVKASPAGGMAGRTKDGEGNQSHASTADFTGKFLPKPTEGSLDLGALDPSKIFRAPPTFTPNQFSGPQAKPFVPTDGNLEAMIRPSSYLPTLRLSTSKTLPDDSKAAAVSLNRSAVNDQRQLAASSILTAKPRPDPDPSTLVTAGSPVSPDALTRSVGPPDTTPRACLDEPPFPGTEAMPKRLHGSTSGYNPARDEEHRISAVTHPAADISPVRDALVEHHSEEIPHSDLPKHTDDHRLYRDLSGHVRKRSEKERESRHLPVRDLEIFTQHRSSVTEDTRNPVTLDHSNRPKKPSSHAAERGSVLQHQRNEPSPHAEKRHELEQQPPFMDIVTMSTRPGSYEGEAVQMSAQVWRVGSPAKEKQSSSPVTRPGSQVSNTSRRRGLIAKQRNPRRSNRRQLQKTLESWQVMLNDYEQERAELLEAIDQRDEALRKQCDRIARGKHQLKECSSQLESLRRENSDLVRQNHALRDQVRGAAGDADKVEHELDNVHTQLEKLRGRYNNLKEHLNKAIAEQQRLYQDVQASYAKTKEEMEISHQQCESEQSRTLARMEALRKEFQEAAAEKRAAAEQQREEANAMITHLRQKLQETEKELAATAEKAAGLAQRLEDRTAQHDQLQKLECQAERILATLTDESERATSLDLHNVLVQKLEQVRRSLESFENLKQLKPDLDNSVEATMVKTLEPLARSLHETLLGQNVLRDLLDRTDKNFQKELTTLHTRQSSWEADKCQEVIKLAQEKTKCATLLEAKNKQLEKLELARLEQSEEVQKLKQKVATLEAMPREDPNLAVEIAQHRDASAKKDEMLAEWQKQSQAAETSQRNALEKLRHQLLQAEEKLQAMEEQLRTTQKAADLNRQEISVEYQKKACGLEMELERSKASQAALSEKLTKVREELSWVKATDPGAELVKLRRELKDAEQRIANLSCKLKGAGLSTESTGDDTLKRLEWVYGNLQDAQGRLDKLTKRDQGIQAMQTQFQAMLEIQRVLYHTHQHCLAETQAAEARLAGDSPQVHQDNITDPPAKSQRPSDPTREPGDLDRHAEVAHGELPTAGQHLESQVTTESTTSKRIVLRTPSQHGEETAAVAVSAELERTKRRLVEPGKSILRLASRTKPRPPGESSIAGSAVFRPVRMVASPSTRPVEEPPREAEDQDARVQRSKNEEIVEAIKNRLVGPSRAKQAGLLPSPAEWLAAEKDAEGKRVGRFDEVQRCKKKRGDVGLFTEGRSWQLAESKARTD